MGCGPAWPGNLANRAQPPDRAKQQPDRQRQQRNIAQPERIGPCKADRGRNRARAADFCHHTALVFLPQRLGGRISRADRLPVAHRPNGPPDKARVDPHESLFIARQRKSAPGIPSPDSRSQGHQNKKAPHQLKRPHLV